jgi:ubiquinone/menaquinone biosynthesis C-methylase UbiE
LDPGVAADLADHLTDYFDAVAPSYEEWAGGLHGRVAGRLAEIAGPEAGEDVLDVGCGTGLVTHAIAKRVGRRGSVVGIDLSARMLEIAAVHSQPNTKLVGMAAEQLVFKSSSFELVTMGESLAYLIDPPAALAEAWRVLRPEGRIAVSCHRRSLSTIAQDIFFQGLAVLARRHHLTLPRHTDDRARLGEPEVLIELLDDTGFEKVAMTEMVTGGRAANARAWTELMEGAGPLPFTLLRVLGPELRAGFEQELAVEMRKLGEESFHYHHAYVFAVARRKTNLTSVFP